MDFFVSFLFATPPLGTLSSGTWGCSRGRAACLSLNHNATFGLEFTPTITHTHHNSCEKWTGSSIEFRIQVHKILNQNINKWKTMVWFKAKKNVPDRVWQERKNLFKAIAIGEEARTQSELNPTETKGRRCFGAELRWWKEGGERWCGERVAPWDVLSTLPYSWVYTFLYDWAICIC